MVDKNKVIESLRELSDIEFQRRAWLAESGPEVSSFTEAVCQLFDDTGLSDALAKSHYLIVFTKNADEGLRELRQAISRIDESLSADSLIQHPQMQKVRNLASNVLQQLLENP